MHLALGVLNATKVVKVDYKALNGSLLTGYVHLNEVKISQGAMQLHFDALAIDWSPRAMWHGELKINSVVVESAHYNLDFALEKINGTYRGQVSALLPKLPHEQHPQTLHGEIKLTQQADQAWLIDKLVVTAKDSALHASGRIGQQWQVDYQLTAPKLQHWQKDLSGAIKLSGKITGPRKKPLAITTMDVTDLQYQQQLRFNGRIFNRWAMQSRDGETKLQLRRSALDLPLYGLRFHSDDLLLSTTDMHHFKLTGQVQSPHGPVRFHGEGHMGDDGLTGQVTAEAKDLLVLNTTEAKMVISGAATLQQNGDNAKLTANIHIPKANFSPRDLSSTVKTSADVVFVGEKSTAKPSWLSKLASKASITLGDEVQIDGYNLQAKLTGQLQIQKNLTQLTTATGSIKLGDATYNLYGTPLKLNKGVISYTETPIANPNLDFLAKRDVNVVKSNGASSALTPTGAKDTGGAPTTPGVVSVTITGKLDQPKLNLQSTVPMSEPDKLSYLLLGVPSSNLSAGQGSLLFAAASDLAKSFDFSPMATANHPFRKWAPVDTIDMQSKQYVDEATGETRSQTSLVVGKSLSPKLYVQYAIGLVNPVNVLQVNYRLGHHFKLQTTTDTEGNSGGDLIFSSDE